MDSKGSQSSTRPVSPLYERRSRSPTIMPLIIGQEETPMSASSPIAIPSPFKSPSLTLSPNIINGSFRNISSSSRSSCYSSVVGSSLSDHSKSPTCQRYRPCLGSTDKELDDLPVETLEDRISRWMLWANEGEKKKYEESKSKKEFDSDHVIAANSDIADSSKDGSAPDTSFLLSPLELTSECSPGREKPRKNLKLSV